MSQAIERVELLAETYRSNGGNLLKHGPRWNHDRWKDVIAKSNLPMIAWGPSSEPQVTRGLLLDLWANALDEDDAVNAFFLTMVWGLGDHYLGPFKMKKMLNSRSVADLGSFLLKIRERVASDIPGAFIEVLRGGIKHLGPVYATKLLYAMSPVANRSPVMDVWVERWGSTYGFDFGLDSSRKWAWNADKLARFASFCDDCIGSLTEKGGESKMSEFTDRGFIEYLIFWDSKYRLRKSWTGSPDFPHWILAVGKVQ